MNLLDRRLLTGILIVAQSVTRRYREGQGVQVSID